MSIEVFFSYSEQDEQLRDELEKHLSILKRQGALAIWHHHQITAGTEWQGEIDAHLDSAQVILLLVSPDFFAADYICEVEIQRAMERHASRLARVIPVLLRPVDNWQEAPFGKLQPLPTNGKPVTTWENRDRAFENIAAGIRKILESFSSEKTSLEIGEGVREKQQQWEKLVNLLMRWRPAEGADPNILIITVAREDIEYQDHKEMIRSGSLADEALAKLLQKLKPYNPAVIGLDILRDEPQDCQSAELAVKLRNELFGARFMTYVK